MTINKNRAPRKNGKGSDEMGAVAWSKTEIRTRLAMSSRNIADVRVDLIVDLTFSSFNVGTTIATEEELKQTPKISDEKLLNPKKKPTRNPVTRGIAKLNTVKITTFLPVFFKTENFMSNPAVNMRKTRPMVARKSVTSPG